MMRQPSPTASLPLRRDLSHCGVYAVLLLLLTFLFPVPLHAAEPSDIKANLKAQKKKAQSTEKTLSKLTDKERTLHKELAATEDRIQSLERDLGKQEAALSDIEQKRAESEKSHAQLLEKRRKTERELEDLLNAMWPLYIESRAGRGVNLPDWHESDRRFEWSSHIYAAIDAKNRQLAEQQQEIASVLKKQEDLERTARERLASVNKSKDRILRDKLAYNSRLKNVRKQKEDAEAELKNVLSLIQNLNYRLESSKELKGKFALNKGNLPWPARGMLALRYAPEGNPPTRGLGMALMSGSTVQTVAPGKVVHNDVLRGFGRVVIVMHDAEYYSLYAYLADSSLTVGQDVKRGQTLGTAGYFPRVEGTGLYFELRFHQKAINPEPWLTALN
ncbi:peptidoglycan DD-metalloendopeptidase family protein [Desulfovibrio mangrovi]|uniref:murein hydrolase activator EnvC family protein n=1 Tax=Desulfovibrio mangrovi TaxID=2976983 RepID=UPI0022482807|nr:peptidoglycan DD-metalloendopeptidase family protein [Desulfovibrio mangrovi]UZP67408.1 peptidoglycan DD-metalloendopeptidase family protein [Desulfovibrio mangrovi]